MSLTQPEDCGHIGAYRNSSGRISQDAMDKGGITCLSFDALANLPIGESNGLRNKIDVLRKVPTGKLVVRRASRSNVRFDRADAVSHSYATSESWLEVAGSR